MILVRGSSAGGMRSRRPNHMFRRSAPPCPAATISAREMGKKSEAEYGSAGCGSGAGGGAAGGGGGEPGVLTPGFSAAGGTIGSVPGRWLRRIIQSNRLIAHRRG